MIDQHLKRLCSCLLLTLAGLMCVPSAWSQESSESEPQARSLPNFGESIGDGQGAEILDLDGADLTGNPLTGLFKNWPEDLVVAPVPGYSPQLGWNLKLVGGYFLNPDEEADHAASVVGGFVMIAENGSRAYGAGTNLHLLDDKLRVQAGAMHLDVRYDLYGNDVLGSGRDIVIPIEQDGPAFFASGSWRVWKKLYVGMGYLGGEVDTALRFPPPELPFGLVPDFALRLGALFVPIQIDSRDDEMYPRTGWKADVRTVLYRKSLNSDFDANTYKISANHYRPMREQDVLAFRAVVRGTSGDAPFFLLSTLGGDTDLRGYPSGRYRDRYMYAVQGEYRWHFNDSWIFTGFAGFGEVADKLSNFGGEILPATGIGVRFVLSQKHQVSLSADIAVGKDGTEFYFGVGEAF